MAETTSTPVPDPILKKQRQPRGALNASQLGELNKGEQLCLKAQKEEYVTKLVARQITTAFVLTLQADIKTCRDLSNTAVAKTTDLRLATREERELQKNLIAALQEIQTAARQKFRRAQPERLDNYFVGQTLDANRDGLEQYADGILAHAATDDLPGITPEKIAAMTTLRTQYVNIENTQTGEKSGAGNVRGDRDAQILSIKDRRIEIQLAAEAEWPSSNKANASIRAEFSLSPNRPFLG